MKCQPPLDYATYRTVNLDFPRKVKVPRNGIVDSRIEYRKGNVWYTATLTMRISGRKATQAQFTYYTAGYCSVRESFTAKRKGR
jgi:hypothetical protein